MIGTISLIPLADDAAATIGLDVAINNVWVLVTAFLVMFMQPGFALVEAGFTRSKNTGNILMKNILDYCFGSLAFWLIGYSIMFGTDIGGFLGDPLSNFAFTSNGVSGYSDYAYLIFQTVFAATAATIVSGAMAERTKFNAYLIYSVVISIIIYPIEGHWSWGGGWLANMGFHDFAGSTVVHSTGGWAALMGAMVLGPRIGKYVDGKPRAIPGHSLTLAALGVFILWFGWFGFNPGSEVAAVGDSVFRIARIAVTTNLAAAAGGITAMLVAWGRYKRPTISSALNGALAGLVAITAGCDAVSPTGSVLIGAIAGFVLIFSVEFIDKVLKIDDPVGASSVHGVCGALGTLLTGVFATDGGLFYGGGFKMLGVQFVGVIAVAAWSLAVSFILFKILKATNGLRVSRRIEEEGLDVYEHGETCYN